MVPLTDPLAQVLGGETAPSFRAHRGKGIYPGSSGAEDVAMGSEPIGGLLVALLVMLRIAEIQYLYLDARRQPTLACRQFLYALGRCPEEDT